MSLLILPMRIIFCKLFLIALIVSVHAQSQDTLDLRSSRDKISLINHAYYLFADPETRIDSIVTRTLETKTLLPFSKFNFGYTNKAIWLVIPIKGVSAKSEYLLEIQNPHLDKIQVFTLTADGIKKLGNETGDHLPFHTRYFYHPNFVWPIVGDSAQTYFIRIEKLNSSLTIPIYLWNTHAHAGQTFKVNLFYGICFGMMAVVGIYSLLAGFFFQAKIYFLYFLFILSAITFLATAEGLSFQLIYPNAENINSLFRVVINGIATSLFVLFSREYLSIKKYSALIDRVLISVAIFFGLLFLITPLLSDFFLKHSQLVVPLVLLITLVANVSCLLAGIVCYQHERRIAVFYLAAYLFTLISAIISITEDFGWIEKLPFNPLFIGALIEILVFSIGLTYVMKKVYDERNELTLKIARHQKEMMQAYVQGVEKERERIAGELHDDIGSRLSALQRMVSSNTKNQDVINDQIHTLSEDIRNLSHQILPPSMLNLTLQELVSNLAASQHKSNLDFHVHYYDVPENLPANFTHQVFRIIQEAVNNIIKHAQASTADIQIFGYRNELVITIEDNGKGFTPTPARKGLGLSQMYLRAETLGGKLEISSSAEFGTNLLVTLPLE